MGSSRDARGAAYAHSTLALDEMELAVAEQVI